MCGIAGIIELGAGPGNASGVIVDMADAMSLRGPDGEGFFFTRGLCGDLPERLRARRPQALVSEASGPRAVTLAHRRLSIIDLSVTAGQPMSNAQGTIHVVFNGEIYNHMDIRRELESLGAEFRTSHSDTEVIIKGYEQWGIDCIHRFRGMFAFALWDADQDALWLVRDRVGIKPLYYAEHDGNLYFASEIKAILQEPSFPRVLDEEAFFHYLSFLVAPAPMSLFKGVFKLPAGCRLCVRRGRVGPVERYWDVFDDVVNLAGRHEADVADMLMQELRESVRLRGVADVPVGIFLSGGIDSSTNLALFCQGAPARVKSFCVGYAGTDETASYPNEFKYARRAAELAGSDHYEKEITQQELLDFLPEMVRLQDEPIADPVCVPVYFVSRLAREQGVSVCQAGEGSDEMFCGYARWLSYRNLQRLGDLPVPAWAKRTGLWAMRAAGRDDGYAYELLRRNAQGERVFWSGAQAFMEPQKQLLMSPGLKERFAGRSSWEIVGDYHRDYLARTHRPDNAGWMAYADLRLRLPELLLMRLDKMTMAVSLESRVPFLDHRLAGLAMSIPEVMKVSGNETKHILKRAVSGLIPDDLIHRPKQGFGVPVYEWFLDKLGTYARQEIAACNACTELFDRAYLDGLFARGKGKQLWYILNVALWWKEYLG